MSKLILILIIKSRTSRRVIDTDQPVANLFSNKFQSHCIDCAQLSPFNPLNFLPFSIALQQSSLDPKMIDNGKEDRDCGKFVSR